MFRRIKIRKIVGLTTAVALVTAGAYAYWTNGGSGSGTAVTGSNAAITVTQTTSPTGLYPGGPAAALAGKFNNGNDGKVYVNDVDATIASVTGPNIDATHPCDASDYVLSGFPVSVDAEVNAGTAQGSWSGGGIALTNSAANQDGCKGATVNLTYTSN
jgi:hypothetical protein